ncbi:NAD(P)-dependent oxidoreductase [Streptomyces sp. MW-W600-10]|uniref:NAD-dependent epimerase/dehydratase family protein n=1 Tax=Streptomyces sp. MW-W600-10 TaxID=2829819 RepID=UPI00210C31F3|nr:NAD-dependent epimerase/dehydratase family protein [Streptomyces sp. MW-W600-10]
MSRRRVVVTGGCGFVGSHLVEQLVNRGDDVVVFDSGPFPPGFPAGIRDQVKLVIGDIRDAEAVLSAIRPGVDVVFHLAAVVGVDQYLARPLDVIDINLNGTRLVLDAAARAGAKPVIASTSEIFGKNPSVPWPEDGDRVLGPTTADRWTYSSSKALAEHMTFAFSRAHGLGATVVRYFNVYGPRQRPAYAISRSLHRVLNGLGPIIYDGGRQTRAFTHISDCIEGTLKAAEDPIAANEAFNIGSMAEITIGDAVDLIIKLVGSDVKAISLDTRDRLGPAYEDLQRRVPDTHKAQSQLGWTCHTSLRDGLLQTIDWACGQPQWLALPDSGAAL